MQWNLDIYIKGNRQRLQRARGNTLFMRGYRGGRGGAVGPDPPPRALKNHKAIWFLSNTCPDPMKIITKLPSQHSMLGHHRPARFAGRPMMARFYWYLDPLVPNQLKI